MAYRNLGALREQIPALVEDPSTVNTADQDPELVLGGLYFRDGKLYRYVQFKDAVAYAAGHVCEWANATGTAVTNDRAGGSSVGRVAAGVALRVMTQNYYGFILVKGFYGTLLTDGGDDIAAGDFLYPDPTVDGAVDSYAVAGANPTAAESVLGLQCFAQAVAADVDANNTVAAMVDCL